MDQELSEGYNDSFSLPSVVPEVDIEDEQVEVPQQSVLETLLTTNFKEAKPKKQKKEKVVPFDQHDKQLYEQAYKRKTTLSQPMQHVNSK